MNESIVDDRPITHEMILGMIEKIEASAQHVKPLPDFGPLHPKDAEWLEWAISFMGSE